MDILETDQRASLPTPQSARVDGWLLAVLVVFTVAAVAGYATFGRHPEMVASVPGAARWYGVSLNLFPIAQVWLAFAVMAAYMTRRIGLAWLPAFVVLYGVSLTSELLGTGYGIPFGPYSYAPMLGAEWLGRVPVVIPLSWFTMSVSSYAIARQRLATSSRASKWGGILIASLLLLCWDLSLDPAMSHATTYWVWGAHGPYYGMPWSNLLGWYITGLLLCSIMMALGADRWIRRLPTKWFVGFYAANLVLSLGMSAAAGLWLAVAVTALALGGVATLLSVGGRAAVPKRTSFHTAAAVTE
ncbi:MAG: carotenoid biosynthesis protein [Gemmatimonadaceae bacterium]